MSGELIAAGVAAVVALAASPYLASLSVTAPDRALRTWWRPRRCSRTRYTVTAAAAVVLAALAGEGAGSAAAWPAFLTLALVTTVLALVDVEHHRLPDRLMAAGAIAGTTLLTVAALIDQR